jgi:hypothetical protein
MGQELRQTVQIEVPTLVPSPSDAGSDPDLDRLNDAWATLPAHHKAAILALLDAAGAAPAGSRPENVWCAECRKHNRLRCSTQTDHIIPHNGDETLFWTESNSKSSDPDSFVPSHRVRPVSTRRILSCGGTAEIR